MIARLLEKNESAFQRFLEVLPGFSTWAVMTSPIWLGIFYPEAIVYILTFFTVYWSFLSFRHTIGMYQGYNNYKREMAMDWMAACNSLNFTELPEKATLPKKFEDLRHLILIPAVNEPERVLKSTMDALAAQTFPLEQVVIVFTIEARGAEKVIPSLENVIKEYKHRFCKFLIYTHPAGIPGEAVGAGAANRTWGAKNGVAELKESGENLRNYIFTTIDADHVLDRQYLARLSHLYLTADRRDHHYYSTAVYLFNNNLWRVPPLMRIEANAVTLACLSDWIVTKPNMKDTFSSYSLSLQTLMDADYWDVSLGVDDTIMYWRAFFAREGDFDGMPHWIPFSADAVEGKNFLDSHISLYKQLLRWGWGIIEFPLSMKGLIRSKTIPVSRKIAWLVKHFEKRVLLLNTVFLITFGFSLVTLVNPYVKQSNFAYSLPQLMSAILTITLVCILPGTYYRVMLAAPFPKDWSLIKRFLAVFIEGPLIIVNLLTYSFFPAVEAQTRMLLGKKMKDLYHTPKVG
jgi:hypothetical protein